MEYAVYNLLTNAVKYSPAGTEAYVSAERSGKEVRITVRDQGIGMEEKELNNVFQEVLSHEEGRSIGRSGNRNRAFYRRTDCDAARRAD
jgi:signal transduction histidine kinase